MRSAHTVAQVRDAEAVVFDALVAEGLPEEALMRRAAVGLAHAVVDFLGAAYGRRVLVLAGSGNNGGDALWAGALLAQRGAAVQAVLLDADRAHPAGLSAFTTAGGRVVEVGESTRPHVLLDGIVGIGARGGIRPDAVAALKAHPGVSVVSVDIPSGVDVDTGEILGEHVRADLTVTFGTHKICHLIDPAAAAAGALHLVDIGLELPRAPVEALGAREVEEMLPHPDPAAQKYTRGVVGVRAGSQQYPGAAVLATAGAAIGFAGMVRYAGDAASAVLAVHPDVVVGPGRVQAWVVGSGGGERAGEDLGAALADGVPLVVDADALSHLPERIRSIGPATVLTPHAGELARLLGVARADVEERPLEHVRHAAQRYGCVVLLKGRRTLVSEPGGRVRVNLTGVPWLATAGAGDVLAGLIGALLAAGLAPLDAASVGAWLHGAAATWASSRSGGPIRAGDLPDGVRAVVAGLVQPTS